MIKRNLYMIVIIFIFLTFSNISFSCYGIPFAYKVYTIETEYTLYNKGNSTIWVDLNKIQPGFYLALDIDGWQNLINFTFYINGSQSNKVKIMVDGSGNKRLVFSSSLKIRPKEKIVLKLIQNVRVNSVTPLFSTRKKICMPKTSVSLGNLSFDEKVFKRYLSTRGFWRIDSDIAKISDKIATSSTTVREYILAILRWIIVNIQYNISKRGGIAPPRLVIKSKKGACGEFSSLVVVLARAKRIPAYLYLSYYYDPNLNVSIKSGDFSYAMVHAFQHVFAMVCLSENVSLPVDLTLPKRNLGEEIDAIDNAGINIMDNIIIVNRIIDQDPNDFLMISSPTKNVSISYKVTIMQKSGTVFIIEKKLRPFYLILLLVIVVVIAIIIFLRERTDL